MKKIKHIGISSFLIASTLFGITPAFVQAEDTSAGMSAQNQPTLRFSVISDIHVEAKNDESISKIKRALTDLHTIAPDSQALVVNGDLGHGTNADYVTLHKVMKNAPLPPNVFYTIGNHEYYNALHDKHGNWSIDTFPNGETEKDSQTRFSNFVGRPLLYDDAWVSGYHFLMLGSEAYRQTDPSFNEDAWLSDKQLRWLEQKLKEKEQPDKPIFVFLHQPLPYTVAGSSTPYNNRGVVQHERLKAILEKHPQVIFFSGHTHWELTSAHTFFKKSFTMVNSSSVYEPYDESDKPYSQKLNRSEGLAVEVYSDKVVIQGRDFTNRTWVPNVRYEVKTKREAKTVQHVAQAAQDKDMISFWIQWETFVRSPISLLASSPHRN